MDEKDDDGDDDDDDDDDDDGDDDGDGDDDDEEGGRSNSAPPPAASSPSLSPSPTPWSPSPACTANRRVHLPVYPIRGATTPRRPEGDEEGRKARGQCRTLLPECRPAAVARTIVAPMARAWGIVPYDRIVPTTNLFNQTLLWFLSFSSRHHGRRCIAIGHFIRTHRHRVIVLFVTQ